jgi:hypothetical protein
MVNLMPARKPLTEKGILDSDFLLRPIAGTAVAAARSATARLDDEGARALTRAAGAFGRLDRALEGHPLLPAVIHRARLEAVRRQAGVDGLAIDPWHLAAVLEGLKVRMDGALRIIDRGVIFEATRAALTGYSWLVTPDFDEEGQVMAALTSLRATDPAGGPLLRAARWLRTHLDADGARAPARAALVRWWTSSGLLAAPIPLTGPGALNAGAPWDPDGWIASFLDAVAAEADDVLALAQNLEREWMVARARATTGRRSNSQLGPLVDFLATVPLASPTTAATVLSTEARTAAALFDELVACGAAVEVTHRSARRLFGLPGMEPMRDAVQPPRRPDPGRGRGRPRHEREVVVPEAILPLPPIAFIARRTFDYSGLAAAIAEAEATIRRTRINIDAAITRANSIR